MKFARFLAIAAVVALVSSCWTSPRVRYVQASTGREIPVTRGTPDLSGLSGGGGGSIGPIIQIVQGGCSGGSTSGIFDANGGFVSLLSGLIPAEPKQADIDFAKKFLSPTDGAVLQILFNNFPEVLLDGVHDVGGPFGGSCPILVLSPLLKAHASGSISDADFAAKYLRFFKAKYNLNLNGRQAQAKAQLLAAGLPLP